MEVLVVWLMVLVLQWPLWILLNYMVKNQLTFLDVGGGASKEKVSAALKIILSDKNVKGILINIFGGIMRCDVLAQGVVDAAKEINISVPLVVRLAGTNFKEGKDILDNSEFKTDFSRKFR